MSEEKRVVDMTPEELEEWMDILESSPEEIPCYYFSNPDPYAKCEPSRRALPEECFFDEEGNIHVKNISAYWIPEFTMTQEIAGTVYKVSGSYEGTEFFTKKIERMLADKLIKTHQYNQWNGILENHAQFNGCNAASNKHICKEAAQTLCCIGAYIIRNTCFI